MSYIEVIHPADEGGDNVSQRQVVSARTESGASQGGVVSVLNMHTLDIYIYYFFRRQ